LVDKSIEERVWQASKFRQREKEILSRYLDEKNRSDLESFK
jgi:hypothetical protein